MRQPVINDVIILASDLPYLNLSAGERGIVRGLWKTAALSYEVEFTGSGEKRRAVLVRSDMLLDLTSPAGSLPLSGTEEATGDMISQVAAW